MQRFTVNIKPGSKKGPLVVEIESGLTIYVRERAVDGKANEAVINILSKFIGIPKSQIRLVRGHNSRIKSFQVSSAKE